MQIIGRGLEIQEPSDPWNCKQEDPSLGGILEYLIKYIYTLNRDNCTSRYIC